MKPHFYTLLSVFILSFIACDRTEKTNGNPQGNSPQEEYYVAYEYMRKGTELDKEKFQEQRMAMFDKATYHLAQVVVSNETNDTLRANALLQLRWIDTHVRRNYAQSLQYLNAVSRYIPADDAYYPNLLAYKADDLWHFGTQDSAIHYANKALSLPHKQNGEVDYISHYVLWQIYEQRNMVDSANHHKQQHFIARDSKSLEPMTLDELKKGLQEQIITPESQRVKVTDALTTQSQQQEDELAPSRKHRNFFVVGSLVLLLACFVAYRLRKQYRRKNLTREIPRPLSEAQDTDAMGDEPNDSFTLPEALILRRSLDDGRRAFENTASFTDLNSMQIKEKELYDMAYEATRDVESALFTSFKDACNTLHEDLELNDQELICCFCSYLGYTNNVIAYIGHTTPSTIRKRKERIRKKLPADFCEIIFRGNAGDK